MSKVILAEYDAVNRALKLSEPLSGVEDRATVRVAVEASSEGSGRAWMAFRGCLPVDAAEELARNLAEAAAPMSLEDLAIDSSAAVDFFNPHRPSPSPIEEARRLFLPLPVLGELRYGVLKASPQWRALEKEKVEGFV